MDLVLKILFRQRSISGSHMTVAMIDPHVNQAIKNPLKGRIRPPNKEAGLESPISFKKRNMKRLANTDGKIVEIAQPILKGKIKNKMFVN